MVNHSKEGEKMNNGERNSAFCFENCNSCNQCHQPYHNHSNCPCCPIIPGPIGPTDPQGLQGIQGVTGPTGPTGVCTCPCQSHGELIVNGGMETVANNFPTGWLTTTPNLINIVTQQGRVHSGNNAVNLENGAILEQNIPINGSCYYDFSFFAHGEGSQANLIATLIFTNATGLEVIGGQITINSQDMPNSNRSFGYYRTISTLAPANATNILIRFVINTQGSQSVDIDDVSLSID